MRYLYADFTSNSKNFGNHVIEYATQYLLRDILPAPTARFESFAGQVPKEAFDFVLVPGCTMITAGQNPALMRVGELACPAYCLAGSIWMKEPRRGLLLRTRIIGRGRPRPVDLSVVRLLRGPVGCRDPFTFEEVRKGGFKAIYTGCPTLRLPADGVSDDGFILVSLGREAIRAQTHYARVLAKRHHVIGIVHEPSDWDRARAAGWKLPLVRFTGDVEDFLSYFKRAMMVVTGRLHGLLPALAYTKRVVYYGTRDTRTSILDDLGVPIHGFGAIARAAEIARHHNIERPVARFRANWDALVEQIVSEHMR